MYSQQLFSVGRAPSSWFGPFTSSPVVSLTFLFLLLDVTPRPVPITIWVATARGHIDIFVAVVELPTTLLPFASAALGGIAGETMTLSKFLSIHGETVFARIFYHTDREVIHITWICTGCMAGLPKKRPGPKLAFAATQALWPAQVTVPRPLLQAKTTSTITAVGSRGVLAATLDVAALLDPAERAPNPRLVLPPVEPREPISTCL